MEKYPEAVEQIYRICQSSEFLRHVWKVHIKEAYEAKRMFLMHNYKLNGSMDIIGFIEAYCYKRNNIVHLKHMGVREDFRRQGIMASLLRNAEETYKDRYIMIETRASNVPMNSFLAKHGYTLTKVKTVGKNDILVNVYAKQPKTSNKLENFV